MKIQYTGENLGDVWAEKGELEAGAMRTTDQRDYSANYSRWKCILSHQFREDEEKLFDQIEETDACAM